MKVIFLDFNGVLDTNEKMDEINSDNLKRLKHIVEETNAKIVISSSIKRSYYYTGKYSKMLIELINRITEEEMEVIGITPNAKTREEEIQDYLNEHPEIENFCIIDDDYDMESFKSHMVKLPCQIEVGQMGLDDYHMNMAIEILNKDKQKQLRDKLFDAYFEVDDGINVMNLINSIQIITDTWNKLHKLLDVKLEDYDYFTSLKRIKRIQYKNNPYLVLETEMFDFLIVDLKIKQVLTSDEELSIFEDDFFNDNLLVNMNYKELFYFLNYYGDIEELIKFYNQNEHLLNIPTHIYYKLTVEDAWTYFSIDLANAKSQVGFQTPDQTLYEQIFLNFDLTPSKMQDATSRIGRKKMIEIFEKIKEIRIPKKYIPKEIYRIYLESNKNLELENDNGPRLIKK